MYIMPSTPRMDSSSGVATVSAMTLGLAPGYTVRTTTEGGTTSGYSPIGSSGIEIRPAAKITIDSTAAKIGRSMKNLEKSMGKFLVACLRRIRMQRGRPARPSPRGGGERRGSAACKNNQLIGKTCPEKPGDQLFKPLTPVRYLAPAALATSFGGGAPIAICFGDTGMPGKKIFCTPCTITLSAGVSPDCTTRSPSMLRPSTTSLRTASF